KASWAMERPQSVPRLSRSSAYHRHSPLERERLHLRPGGTNRVIHSRMAVFWATRCAGEAELMLCDAPGTRRKSTSTFLSIFSAVYHCSLCSMGQRQSSSAPMTRVGVVTARAYVMGERSR